MAWSRILLPDGDPLPDAFHNDHALVIRDGEQLSLLCSQEILGFDDPGRAELEEVLIEGPGGGAPVFRADLAHFEPMGEVLACGEGLEIRCLPDAELLAALDPISIGRVAMGRVGGPRARELALLVDRAREPRPAIRKLLRLPPERGAGLMPFLTAVGAEPIAVMDDSAALIAELDRRGPGWVAAIARGGAFLWKLDLQGREGLDGQSAQRIDEDVILPLTAGLDRGEQIDIGGDLGDIVLEARRGDFDLAFLCPPTPRADLDQLEASGAHPAFGLAPELPGSLGVL